MPEVLLIAGTGLVVVAFVATMLAIVSDRVRKARVVEVEGLRLLSAGPATRSRTCSKVNRVRRRVDALELRIAVLTVAAVVAGVVGLVMSATGTLVLLEFDLSVSLVMSSSAVGFVAVVSGATRWVASPLLAAE